MGTKGDLEKRIPWKTPTSIIGLKRDGEHYHVSFRIFDCTKDEALLAKEREKVDAAAARQSFSNIKKFREM